MEHLLSLPPTRQTAADDDRGLRVLLPASGRGPAATLRITHPVPAPPAPVAWLHERLADGLPAGSRLGGPLRRCADQNRLAPAARREPGPGPGRVRRRARRGPPRRLLPPARLRRDRRAVRPHPGAADRGRRRAARRAAERPPLLPRTGPRRPPRPLGVLMSAAPAESLPGPAPWIVAAVPPCIALAFVLCALLRPAVLWEPPKVQLGRGMLGDAPLSAAASGRDPVRPLRGHGRAPAQPGVADARPPLTRPSAEPREPARSA